MYPCCVRTLEWCCILSLLEGCSLLTVSYLNSCRMFAMLFSSPGVLLFTKHFTIYIFFLRTCSVWKNQNTESNVENAKIQNSNVWKNQNSQFLCLEKPKHWILMLKKPKSRIPMFGNTEMQFFEKQNSWIPMFAKCRTRLNLNFFLKPKSRIPCNVWKKKNIEF